MAGSRPRGKYPNKLGVTLFALTFALIGTILLFQSFASPTDPPGDLNSDNTVNVFDLSILLSNWNQTNRTPAQGDLNNDTNTNIFDLSILLSNWGRVGGSGGNSYYIRDGGTGNCSDWTNACDMLPATLERGATYYVAAGTYNSYTFDDAVSGTQLITIKKATAQDHGTNSGWQSAYGDGRAEFGPLNFITQYWVFDGQTRVSPKSGHGFYVNTGTNVNPSSKGVRLNGSGNVTIRYVEIVGHGPDDNGGGNDLIYASQPVNNVTISYAYLHDAGRTHMLSRGGSNWTIEHSVFYRNESTAAEHAESWSPGTTSNVILRHNIFEETDGTGVIATLDNNPGPDNWEIYGNVFLNCDTSLGIAATDSESSWTNVKFYNNTIANTTGLNAGLRVSQGSGVSWQIYNNLWYNNTNVSFSAPDSMPHDYNWFYGSGTQSEAHIQNGSGNPFINLAAGDLRLNTATNAGLMLNSPYNTDPLGLTRGQDGTWDRGAYEYQ